MRKLIEKSTRSLLGLALIPVAILGIAIFTGLAQYAIRFVLIGCFAAVVGWPVSRFFLGCWAIVQSIRNGRTFFATYDDPVLEERFAWISLIVAVPLAVFLFVVSLGSPYWR
jgi:hypothetical protein